MAPKRKNAGKGSAKGGLKKGKAAAKMRPVENAPARRSTRGSSAAPPPEREAPKRKASAPSPSSVPEKKVTPAKKGRAASPSPAPKARQASRGRAASAQKKTEQVEAKIPKASELAAKGRGRSDSAKQGDDSKKGRVTRAVVEAVSKKTPTKPEPRARSRSAGTKAESSKVKAETPKQKSTPKQKAATPKQKAAIPKQKAETPKQKAAATPKTPQSKKKTPKASPKKGTPKVTPKAKAAGKSPKTVIGKLHVGMPEVSVSLEKMDEEEIRRSSQSPTKEKSSPGLLSKQGSKSLSVSVSSPRSRRSRNENKEEKVQEAAVEEPMEQEPAVVEEKESEDDDGETGAEKPSEEEIEPEQADEPEIAEEQAVDPAAVEQPDKPVAEKEAGMVEAKEIEEVSEKPTEDEAEPAVKETKEEKVAPFISDSPEPIAASDKPGVVEIPEEDSSEAQVINDSPKQEEDASEVVDLDAEQNAEVVDLGEESEIQPEPVQGDTEEPVVKVIQVTAEVEKASAQDTHVPVVEVPDAEMEENEESNQTGVEIAEEAGAEDVEMIEDDKEAAVPPLQLGQTASGSQPNGEKSEPLISPRKRKHDELEDGYDDEEILPKKIRRSLENDEAAQFVGQSNGEGAKENLSDSYVVIDMQDVPASESSEVLQSLPKEQSVSESVTSGGGGGESKAAVGEAIPSQETTGLSSHLEAAKQIVNESGETVNPIFCRTFFPNPAFESGSDSDVVKQFTVVSYNVLADCQLRRNDYSFTESKYLEPDYRLNKLIEEIQYLDGDIVCLQEVEPEFFTGMLEERMASVGYKGYYKKRTTEFFNEGEATFFKTSRFTVVEANTYRLTDLIEKELVDGMSAEIQQAIRTYMDRADVLIVTKLRCNATGKELTVGNIHVVWGEMKIPDAQCVQIASAIKEVVSKAGSEGSPHIICGDFNSLPNSPGYLVARDGYLGDDTIPQLQQIQGLKLGEDQTASLVNCAWQAFQHTSSTLKSAYFETQGEEPKVTSFNRVMCACVDYIFYSSGSLDNVGIYRVAPDTKIMETGGTPNCYFPSDHVSIKAKLAFK